MQKYIHFGNNHKQIKLFFENVYVIIFNYFCNTLKNNMIWNKQQNQTTRVQAAWQQL